MPDGTGKGLTVTIQTFKGFVIQASIPADNVAELQRETTKYLNDLPGRLAGGGVEAPGARTGDAVKGFRVGPIKDIIYNPDKFTK